MENNSTRSVLSVQEINDMLETAVAESMAIAKLANKNYSEQSGIGLFAEEIPWDKIDEISRRDQIFCKSCGLMYNFCKHRPGYGTKFMNAEDWQTFYKNQEKSASPSSSRISEPDSTIENESVEKNLGTAARTGEKGKRGRVRTTRLALDSAELAEVLEKFDKGNGVVILSKEYNVQPTYISNYLKEQGRTIKRGNSNPEALAKARAVRAAQRRAAFGMENRPQKEVVTIDNETLQKMAKRHFENLVPIGTFAAELGMYPAEVSAQLKAIGCEPRRGNPKHWTPIAWEGSTPLQQNVA